MAESISDPKIIAESMKGDAFMMNLSVTVLTEDSNDNLFWQRIIKYAVGYDKLYFPLELQKGSTVIKKYENYVDDKLIICTDSDSKFLYTPKKENWYFDKQYIYHTWIYSMDSYHILAESLNELLKEITQANAQTSYDFDNLIRKLSNSLSPFLYSWVFSYHQKQAIGIKLFNQSSLDEILKESNKKFNDKGDEEKLFDEIERLVNIKVEALKSELSTKDSEKIDNLGTSLFEDYSIKKSEAVFFLNGHKIFDFISRLLRTILEAIKKEHIQILSASGLGNEKTRKLEKHYNAHLHNLPASMKRMPNYEVLDILYSSNLWIAKIINSIKSDFE